LRNSRDQKVKKDEHPINENIRAKKVQLISHEGENIGVVDRSEALTRARNVSLDLVMIAASGKDGIPVTKIMDYGKVLYEKKKKQNEAKKHQKTVQIKELKMRPKIGEHDLQTKIKQGVKFLEAGKHLKITLVFRGRERIDQKARSEELFEKIEQKFIEHGLDSIMKEKDISTGPLLSRIYYLKSGKK